MERREFPDLRWVDQVEFLVFDEQGPGLELSAASTAKLIRKAGKGKWAAPSGYQEPRKEHGAEKRSISGSRPPLPFHDIFASSLSSACLFVVFETVTQASQLVFAPSVEPVSDYPSGSPIPAAQDAPSAKQFSVICAAWANRVIVGEYRRSHPEDTNVPAFLSDVARYLWRGNEQVRKQLSFRGRNLNARAAPIPPFS